MLFAGLGNAVKDAQMYARAVFAANEVNLAVNATVTLGPATGTGSQGEGVLLLLGGGSYIQAVTQEAMTLYRAYAGTSLPKRG